MGATKQSAQRGGPTIVCMNTISGQLWIVGVIATALFVFGAATSFGAPVADELQEGRWRAWVETPGGPLPFWLENQGEDDGSWSATIINGSERVEIPIVVLVDGVLTLGVDYYDSSIVARVVDGGAGLEGHWTKRRGADDVAKLAFSARAGQALRFDQIKPVRGTPTATSEQISGRWRVRFASSTDDAVGEFVVDLDGLATGTFLTLTGDYRFLEGVFDGSRLRLSCFDGAHAFLFDASVENGPTGVGLRGDFYSGGHWHDTWTATPDPGATLPDAFTQTKVVPGVELGELRFADLDGQLRNLNDAAFAGKARIIEVFGTWCPNCYDASHLLKEFHDRYADRGLAILGLAFEVTGDPRRDSEQVRIYADRMGIPWPILLAGRANKEEASRKLPFLDQLRSYPTIIFVDGDGRVRAIYTGFSGPATGKAYVKLRERFAAIVEAMLAEAH